MRYLWLFWFPLLFLPNLGRALPTGLGTLELSDFLIGPYIALVALAAPWRVKLNVGRLTPWMGLFIAWALLSTITISLRYGYADNYHVEFGLLKIAKLSLYGVAGILTARALARPGSREAFHWSLLGAAVVSGAAIMATGTANQVAVVEGGVYQGYSATNGISVLMAILFAYIGGRLLEGAGTRLWQLAGTGSLLVLAFGWVLSNGRGGWLAAAAVMVYFVFRLGFRRQLVLFLVVGALLAGYLYESQPIFQEQVDKTFLPAEEYGVQQARAPGPIDDGARVQEWTAQAPRFWNAPVLGAGFWHRGGASTLWSTGSHNFWLQMLLELGAVGGLLVASVVTTMWKQATALRSLGRRADVPLKAALIAALVGGLSGEYFYGGIILFTLLAVYAPTGGIPLVSERSRASHAPPRTSFGATAGSAFAPGQGD
jgi:hypothetical protein